MLSRQGAMGVIALLVAAYAIPAATLAYAQDDAALNELLAAEPSSERPSEPASAPEPDPATPESAATASADTTPTIPVEALRSEQPVPPPPTRSGPAQLEEIVVTATKREQSVRDIPASITAFSGEKLENSGKLNLNDFIQETPGVTAAQGSPGFTRLTFRGISTDTNPTAGNAQPVGVFIGDTPFTDPYIANIIPDLSAFDLADVTVLKGPQGTLFGGAALSGAIRYQLEEPHLDEWQLRAFTQYTQPKDGSAAYTYGVALNAPIPDADIALRLNYIHREYPGVTDNLRSGEEDVEASDGDQIRAQLLWQPGDFKFKLTHISQDFNGDDQLIKVESPDGPRATDGAVLKQPSDNQFWMDSLEASYDFESFRVISLTSGVKREAYFTSDTTAALVGEPPAGYPATAGVLTEVTDNSDSFSQELRLQSTGGGDFNWLLGAYFFDYDMYFNILIDTPLNQGLLGPGSLLGTNPLLLGVLQLVGVDAASVAEATSLLNGTSNAKSQERAVFTDLSYELWDEFTVSVGGRLYETETSGGFIGTGVLVAGNQNDGLSSNSTATIKENGFNPKVSATWNFSEHASLYTVAAKGFRFGGLQSLPSTPTNGVPPTYKSDTLWNYEIGLRTNWLDNTLQADLTLFYNDYKNPIVTQQTQGIPINYNTNVSAAVSRGVEGNILWNTPIEGLSWSFAGGLTDAHITEEFTAANGDTVEPGQEMPGAARTQYSTTAQYIAFISDVSIAPSLNYTYVGKGYANITHDVEINGFGTLNAGLLFSTLGLPGNPKLAINLNNVTDVTGPVAGGIVSPIVPLGDSTIYLLNPPRTLTARISLEF